MTPVSQRIITGTPGLDNMLNGGLIPGRLYLVVGPSGSGKTILSVQFLLEGVKQGENVLYLSLDEPPSEVRENLNPIFGSNFDKIRVLDGTLEMKSYETTPVRDVSIQRESEVFGEVFPEIPRSADLRNPDLTASAIQEMIKKEVLHHKVTRIVIDSITSFKSFLLTNGDQNQNLQSFFRFLADLQVTMLITRQEGTRSTSSCGVYEVEDVMSRGVIRLYRWLQINGFRHGIAVEKLRGSEHETRMKRIKIDSIGLRVLDRKGRRKGGD